MLSQQSSVHPRIHSLKYGGMLIGLLNISSAILIQMVALGRRLNAFMWAYSTQRAISKGIGISSPSWLFDMIFPLKEFTCIKYIPICTKWALNMWITKNTYLVSSVVTSVTSSTALESEGSEAYSLDAFFSACLNTSFATSVRLAISLSGRSAMLFSPVSA